MNSFIQYLIIVTCICVIVNTSISSEILKNTKDTKLNLIQTKASIETFPHSCVVISSTKKDL